MQHEWEEHRKIVDAAPSKPWVAETTLETSPYTGNTASPTYTGTILGYHPTDDEPDPYVEVATVIGAPEIVEFVATASEVLPRALNVIRAVEEIHFAVDLYDIEGNVLEVVCAECCVYDDGLTDVCATVHNHQKEPLMRCDTIRALYGLGDDGDE